MNTLPYPLTGKDLEQAIQDYKNQIQGAKERLIEGNLRLAIHVCKRFEGTYSVEDLFQVAVIGLLKNLEQCPSEAGEFSRYISDKMITEIETFLQSQGKYL